MRILLAQSSPIALGQLRLLLDQQDHQITMVGDRFEALELAQSQVWDLILTDPFHPPTDFEPSATIASYVEALASQAPVIVTTACYWPDPEMPARLGIVALLRKPYAFLDLLQIIQSVGNDRHNQRTRLQ